MISVTETSARHLARRAASRLQLATRNMAFQDWLALAFHAFLWTRVALAPESAQAEAASRFAASLLLMTLAVIGMVRGELLPEGRLRALVYRVGLFTPMALSYFELRYLLPALQPNLLDMRLWAIDKALFSVTPSVWMAQFNTFRVVEWFAFFYYSYFWILAGVLVPSLFFDRGRRLQEVMIGAALVCAIGHVTYTFVPGLGPYATLHFDQPLHGGFFWHLVTVAVDNAGAQLDIFPSLHTAYPTFFALHAYGHRRRPPYRYLWPIFAVFAVNIVIATMFLRWHWGIDVVAGLLLALAARQLAVSIASAEAGRHRRPGEPRQPVWEPLWRHRLTW